jgi:hypothetical protein
MPDRRFDELIAAREQAIARHNAEDAARAEQNRRDNELTAEWFAAYTDAELITPAVAEEITRRLLHLVESIRQRFWDFHIANLLSIPPWADHVCLRMLAHACAGNKSELPGFIVRSRNFFPSAYTGHTDLRDYLMAQSAKGLPYTPPISLPEMSRIVGVTRDKFRGDVRAGRWSTIDKAKYQHQRRWRAADASLQAMVLTAIREKWPEKMWSELR